MSNWRRRFVIALRLAGLTDEPSPGAPRRITDTAAENLNVRTLRSTPFNARTQKLDAADIADGIAFMVTRPRHASIAELWTMPSEQA